MDGKRAGFFKSSLFRWSFAAAGLLVLFVVGVVALCRLAVSTPAAMPEQMLAWNRELPVDAAPTKKAAPVAPAGIKPTHQAAPPTSPAHSLDTLSTLTQTGSDFWSWMKQRHPAAYADPRFVAWRAFNVNWNEGMFAERVGNYLSQDQNNSAILKSLRNEGAQFLKTHPDDLKRLDMMLAGGPLPWPSAEEIIGMNFHGIELDTIPPDLSLIQRRILNTVAAAAIADPAQTNGAIDELIRLVLIDRRFQVEPDYPDFLNEFRSGYLIDGLTSRSRHGLINLNGIDRRGAMEFLKRLPAPSLQDTVRSRRMFQMRLLRDRLDLADSSRFVSHCYASFVNDYWNDGWLKPDKDSQGIIGSGKELLHGLVEMPLRYAVGRHAYVASIVQTQKEIVNALDGAAGQGITTAKALSKKMGKSASETIRTASRTNYLFQCQGLLRIPGHNDARLMLHAFMTARAAATPAEALASVRAFSSKWCAGRLEAEPTSAGLRLALGLRQIVVPSGAILESREGVQDDQSSTPQ